MHGVSAVRYQGHTMKLLALLLIAYLSESCALLEKPITKLEIIDGGNKNARNLIASTDQITEGKSSRFFGAVPSFGNPSAGVFPGSFGSYNMGGYPSFPYSSPYGYSPMNYGGFYPINPGFYGNSFGGYSTQQQQQQQQMSHVSAGGAGIGGFQPPFTG